MEIKNNEDQKILCCFKSSDNLVTNVRQVSNKQNNEHLSIMMKTIGFELHQKQKKAEVKKGGKTL